MTYGYIRVSTDKQDCDNQKIGISELARKKELTIEKWIEDDGISGGVDYKKRNLGKLVKRLQKGDIVIVSEISRLARNMFMLFELLKYMTENQIELYTVKDGYTLDGTITSKVLAFGLGLAAEIERDMISKRTIEGLEARRRAGVVLGRPLGSKSKSKLESKKDEVKAYLIAGFGYNKVARLTKVSRNTVAKFCQDNDLEKYKRPLSSEMYNSLIERLSLSPSHNAEIPDINKDEIIELYKNNGFSFDQLRKHYGLKSYSTLQKILLNLDIWDEMVSLSNCQREKVKSNYQIAREEQANGTLGFSG